MNPVCAFCAIAAGAADADIVAERTDIMLIRPLNPVVEGHVIAIPRAHVGDAGTNPEITGDVFVDAAEYARRNLSQFNLITSAGSDATQTVFHLHVHIVPRAPGDGLSLPWTEPNVEALADKLHQEDFGQTITDHAEACPNPETCRLADGYREDAKRYAQTLRTPPRTGEQA